MTTLIYIGAWPTAMVAVAALWVWAMRRRPTVVHLHDGEGLTVCDSAPGETLTDDPDMVTCASCRPVAAARRGDASLDPAWWQPSDNPQASGRDMSRDTASPYPVATSYRDGLTGHTVTIEVLDAATARQYAAPPDDIGRLAVVERMDGWFGTVRHIVQGDATDAETLAEVSALSLGARYVAAEVAR